MLRIADKENLIKRSESYADFNLPLFSATERPNKNVNIGSFNILNNLLSFSFNYNTFVCFFLLKDMIIFVWPLVNGKQQIRKINVALRFCKV